MKQVSKSHMYIFLLALGLVVFFFMAYFLLLGNKMFGRVVPGYTEVQKLNNQSESDSVDSIEKDLNETDLNDLDKELQSIENELNGTN